MKIYSINLSEDGLHTDVYTNIKAMYNGIAKLGYTPLSVTLIEETSPIYTFKDIPYNYANLTKVLRQSAKGGTRYERTTINCEYDCAIHIKEHSIVSK
jgi:hypothetical protein